MAGGSDVCLCLIAIFLPPVAVVLKRGCGADFLINILLTLLGHIPGVIHAIYLILHDREKKRESRYPPPTRTQYPPQQQQHHDQAMYGQGPGYRSKRDVKPVAEPMYHAPPQQQYHDQVQAMPPQYSDYNERDIAGPGAMRQGEKHEYVPHVNQNQGYATKEV